ncbi:MAG: tetratricopeptide repeat protein [Gammaproteobacteria bacterium]|nr:tetratricopeptide repeat protein [Gammaproteobacteria bacterium]
MTKLKISATVFATLLAMPMLLVVETLVDPSASAYAQRTEKPKRQTKRVESIPQALIKDFEKLNEAFDAENIAEAERILNKLEAKPDLNNISRAYIYNYRGNIYFSRDNLNGALREFKKLLAITEGLPESFYNQIIYVVAQVYFSQENYGEALNYAQRWFRTQEDPAADAYMLVGQAQYMLKRYDDALPNVQKGIQKYVDLGSIPKEGWLNLLSSIYRQKNDFKKMLPVLKQLVLHYPKKTYLLTMGGVYNELNDQKKMTAIYQAMYDQGLLDKESELVTLASLHLSLDNPYKAAMIMEKGLDAGIIKKDAKNYRIYSQALYIAREYEKALAPLSQAAKMAKDGKLYDQLGQSYIALNRWKEAERALGNALAKGGLQNPGQTAISQGLARFEQKNYDGAKAAFRKAMKYDKTAGPAKKWVQYVDSEVYRLAELKKEIVINTDVEV